MSRRRPSGMRRPAPSTIRRNAILLDAALAVLLAVLLVVLSPGLAVGAIVAIVVLVVSVLSLLVSAWRERRGAVPRR